MVGAFIDRSKKTKLHWVYDDVRWIGLKYRVLKKYGKRCMKCRSNNKYVHIDHIKPHSKYPELAFDIGNLQVLCRDCNMSKSNLYEDDFRKK